MKIAFLQIDPFIHEASNHSFEDLLSSVQAPIGVSMISLGFSMISLLTVMSWYVPMKIADEPRHEKTSF